MNILELAFSPSWGGLEILVGEFSKRFRNKGHNVIAVIESNPRLEKSLIKNDIEYLVLKPCSKYLDFYSAWKIKLFIKDRKIDIIHTYLSKDLSTAILLKKLLKSGKVVFTQQMDSRYKKKDLFHRWIHKNLDHVVSCTDSMRNNHIEHTLVRKDKISVIYNGVDLSRFNKDVSFDKVSFLRMKNIPVNKIIVGTIGRIDRLKNQMLLVDVAYNLIKKYNNKLHFIFVGEETDSVTGKGYRKELEAKIEEKGLESYFSIFDFTEKAENYFSILDIFVLTTTKESFGFVLLEAMALGKPVLGSDLGGPPEIIEDGINGYIFKPENIEDLANQLSRLISNKELMASMGKKSVEIVKNKFDLNKIIDEYLHTFENIL